MCVRVRVKISHMYAVIVVIITFIVGDLYIVAIPPCPCAGWLAC